MNLPKRINLLRACLAQAFAIGTLLACVTSGLAQTSLEGYAGLGCRPINVNKKSLYISYDSVGLDTANPIKNPQQKVWLRLHNNLTCGIRIPTLTWIETTLPDGTTTTELLPDNQRIPVLYYVQDYKQKKAPKGAPEFYGIDITHWPILTPGKSITFSVALEHFKKRLNVVVIFVYAWEGFNSQTLVHQLYFLNEMLPEQALNQR